MEYLNKNKYSPFPFLLTAFSLFVKTNILSAPNVIITETHFSIYCIINLQINVIVLFLDQRVVKRHNFQCLE